MPNFRFHKGLKIIFYGREYTIEQKFYNGDVQLKDLLTNDFRLVAEDLLINAIFQSNLLILGAANTTSIVAQQQNATLIDDFAQLPEKLRLKAKKRYAYVKQVIDNKIDKCTEESLKPIIAQISQKINDDSPPSWITLYRWFKEYLESGQDIRALVPSAKKQGNYKRKLSAVILQIIDEVIKEKYLRKERPNVQMIYDLIIARIANDNKFRASNDQLKYPHKNAVYRIINNLDPYTKTATRYSKRIADQQHMTVDQGPRPSRPLERVEIDHTKLDLFVIDLETRMPIGRPWMTTAIDVYSKAITGMYMSFNPPSYLSVMQCLRHAIMPKSYVAEKYPSIKNSWNAYGIPEMIIVDNGKEFYSNHFEDACLQLGVVIQYAPPRLAWYKASIERYFGTLNTQLLHNQPGTTFSNTFQKQDYDSTKNAVIPFQTLMEITHKWIIDVYHQKEHRGIVDIPARLWDLGIKQFPPLLPARGNDINILLGQITHRSISPTGIELFGLFYNDERLALLRHFLKSGEKVTIKYNPCDLSLIYVYDEMKSCFIPVMAVNQEYTRGLSLWQHNVIRNYARQKVKDWVDIVALCTAKQDIQKIVEMEWKAAGKSATKLRLARWKGQQSEVAQTATTKDKQSINIIERPTLSGENSLAEISDLENAYKLEPGSVQISVTESGKQEPATISLAEPAIVKVDVANKSQRLSQREKKKNKIEKPHRANIDAEQDDFHPDLTGWSADYSLKK